MGHGPAFLLCLVASWELLEFVGGLGKVQVTQGADSIFIEEVFVDFGEVVGGGVAVWVVDERIGGDESLFEELEVLAFGALLSISCEEEQE